MAATGGELGQGAARALGWFQPATAAVSRRPRPELDGPDELTGVVLAGSGDELPAGNFSSAPRATAWPPPHATNVDEDACDG